MESLNSVFFYQLEKAIKSYRQFAQEQLRVKGFEITIDQWLVLQSVIENPGITQAEIAEKVFKDKASITRILDILEDNGYLQRNAADAKEKGGRRGPVVTSQGKKLLKEIRPVILRNRRTALKKITDKDLMVTLRTLKVIASNCSKNHKS